jgi:formate/nitrite transporter FocA (FNT family)
MAYVKPDAVLDQMVQAGATKARLAPRDLLVRGFLSGALLGFATTLAFTATLQIGLAELLGNWVLVFAANLLGSLFYAWLFTVTVAPDSEMARQLVTVAEAKTLGYAKLGAHGVVVAVVKAILCNWMVTLGVVMALTSQSTAGKIAGMWLPILTFFAQGFEHSVVNMFAIPAGMLMGASVGLRDWWLWNQIPVTLGNVVGGIVFTGLALGVTWGKRAAPAAGAAPAMQEDMVPGR